MSTPDAKEHWEDHYGERERVWSGRVNARLAEIVAPLRPGRALDLGCGEGADAVWLAEHGWHVLAVDIAETALQRAAGSALMRGAHHRIKFAQHDLSESFPEGSFDLVSAQFLHSKLPLDRTAILRRAAGLVRPGGMVVIVDHAGPPPWASKLNHDHYFPSAVEVVTALDLPRAEWELLQAAPLEREATGPNGGSGLLTDNVIVLRRRAD